MRRFRSLIIGIILVLIALWVLTPMARAMWLLKSDQHLVGSAPVIAGIRGMNASFGDHSGVTDNPIPISGWMYVVNRGAPTIILLPGWKEDRSSMVKYATFLLKDGLNTLLIDLQGSGHSGGEFSLGLDEPTDVEVAVGYLDGNDPDSPAPVTNHHYGVFGVSFGAGVAISAAGGNGAGDAGISEISAVVADSPWATQDATVDRLNTVSLFSATITLPNSLTLFGHHITFLPGAQWAVNSTIGGNVDTRSALAGARNLAPNQALLIIHGVNDNNLSTTKADAEALYNAAHVLHKSLWLAPGGHAEAFDVDRAAYEAKVLDFFQKYLVTVKGASSQSTPAANDFGPATGGPSI